MKHNIYIPVRFFLVSLLLFVFFSVSNAAFLSRHIINFGATFGMTYSPSTLNLLVGDTILWVGDFNQYPLQSTTAPIGASNFGVISFGDTFSFVIKVPGEYGYTCPKYASLGMSGGFIATEPHYGLTNEGREFYLGMIYPSYNAIVPAKYFSDFHVYTFISSYYDNEILVSYWDQSGQEIAPQQYLMDGKKSIRIDLNYQLMQLDTASDGTSYKACHIKSKYPITVYYVSVGACAGGSYIALPLQSLGKKYVASSYYDNPGNGAYYISPNTFEYAGGEFIVIGTEDLTNVKITPSVSTVAGHQGVTNDIPHPYSINLNKGQCYLVRTSGRNEDKDISGSLIESSKPVVVISGHENAFLGGLDDYITEGRDLLIEQMTPVEYWDSLGYITVPFAEPTPPAQSGVGDTYRVYTFDTIPNIVHLNVQGISGGYDISSSRLTQPLDKIDVISPLEAYSPAGRKFSLMQYDQRNLTLNSPWPAPSLTTIVPSSRWKSSYFFTNPAIKFQDLCTNTIFIAVIGSNLADINIRVDGKNPTSLSSLSRVATYSNISSQIPGLKANVYRFSAANYTNVCYLLSSSFPFGMYFYGIHDVSFDFSRLGKIKDYSTSNIISEFSSPCGMQLNTGVTPSFKVSVDTNCSGWHICVRDTGSVDPGLKAVILIDDPDAVYWQQPGAKYSNVSFESSAPDYYDNSELHPHVHDNTSYCFDVHFVNGLEAASAPLAIVDNLGNAIILNLDRTAPALKLSTNPPTAKPDSIIFPVKKIGEEICTTFVVKNTAPKNGTALNIASAHLTGKEASYSVKSVIPSLPVSLAAQDSIILQVCYTPSDSARHRDTLKVSTNCFSFSVSLDAHGSTGLISASDLDFPSITVGDTTCKDILIKNVGSAPFTLTKSFVLSDSVNFSINSSSLPKTIAVGTTITINICFHPQTEGPFSAGIDWGTDLEASFAHSIKSHSTLSGIANPKLGVKTAKENSFSIYPNPSNGNSVIVTFGTASGGADSQSAKGTDGLRVRPTGNTTLSMFDVLGREVYHQNILSDISRIEIPLQNIPEGVYYIKLDSPNGSVSQKFVRIK